MAEGEDNLSPDTSQENVTTENKLLARVGTPTARICVRIPSKRNRTTPLLVAGMVAYVTALLSLWVVGSILLSGFLAVLGISFIVGSMHIDERLRTRWL